MGTPLAVALPELAVAASVSHGRPPCVEEVRPERQDELRIFDVEVRHPVLAEHSLDRRVQVGAFERLVWNMPCAVLLGESANDEAEVPPQRIGGNHHPLLAPCLLDVLQVERKPADRVGPANLFELPRAAFARAHHRAPNSIWIVQSLETSFASRAMLAHVGRVIDITLNLARPALHNTDYNAFSGAALPAEGGIPVISPRDEVLRHTHRRLDKQLILRHTAGGEKNRRGRGAAGESQELSSG